MPRTALVPAGHSGTTRHATIDAAAVAVLAVASLVLLAHGGLPLPNPHRVGISTWPAILTVATTGPVLLWRRHPLATVLLAALISSVLAAAGGLVWPPLGIGAAIFCFARGPRTGHRWPRPHQMIAASVVVAFLGIATALSPLAPVLHSAIACLALWFAGERARLRTAEVHQLRADADRAAHEAAQERELAVLEERARIARDLHDTTAHALNVITLRAGTARLRRDAAYTRTVLGDIEQTARDTIGEVDRVVANLRGRPDSIEPIPGLAALAGLLCEHATIQHRVAFTTSGTRYELHASADQGVFRILQESLTNAARHGTGDTTLHLNYEPASMTAEVSNPIDRALRRAGGHGLIGIRERATAIGADISIDESGDRFTVRLIVPTGDRT